MKNKLIVLSGFVLGFTPLVALAQFDNNTTGGGPKVCAGGRIQNISDLLCKFNEILGAILPVLVALGVVYFVFGVITYVVGDDEEAKKKGRDRVVYGIIGLAVIVGVWGLVRILTNTFLGSNPNTTPINYPTVPY